MITAPDLLRSYNQHGFLKTSLTTLAISQLYMIFRLFKARTVIVASLGFTLIEVMVTISLISIILLITAPRLLQFQSYSQLETTVDSFMAAATVARAEATQRGCITYVIPNVPGNWAAGWVAFVDGGSNVTASNLAIRSTSPDPSDIIVAKKALAIPMYVMVQALPNATAFNKNGLYYIRFNGKGYSTDFSNYPTGGALQFTNGIKTKRIVMMTNGQVMEQSID